MELNAEQQQAAQALQALLAEPEEVTRKDLGRLRQLQARHERLSQQIAAVKTPMERLEAKVLKAHDAGKLPDGPYAVEIERSTPQRHVAWMKEFVARLGEQVADAVRATYTPTSTRRPRILARPFRPGR